MLDNLKKSAQDPLNKKRHLTNIKERWLGRLGYIKIKLNKVKTTNSKIRNNNLFNEDEEKFYSKANNTKERNGKVKQKLLDLWGEI